MAARTTGTSRPAAGLPDEPDLAEVVTVLARLTARLIAHVSRSTAPLGQAATFRSIVVGELRIADHADVDVLEAWLTARSPESGAGS